MKNKINLLFSFIYLKIKKSKYIGVSIKSIDVSSDICIDDYVQIPRKCHIRNNVKIGKATYLSSNTVIENNVDIGRFCSIGPNVFIAPGEHYTDFISTHPFMFNPFWRKKLGIKEKKGYIKSIKKHDIKTIIANDVWIGMNVIIMRGVKIGNGAVIGAGSVVTKDVPPYAIVGGVPAKIIKYRFKNNYIEKIQKSEWWNKKIDIDDMYNIGKFGGKDENE